MHIFQRNSYLIIVLREYSYIFEREMLLILLFAAGVYAERLSVFVKECVDGVTCNVDLLGLDPSTPTVFTVDIPVRLPNIEIPRFKGSCMLEKCLAQKALKFTRDRVLKKQVTLEIIGRDKSFRLIGDLKYLEFGSELSLRQKLIDTYLASESFVEINTVSWCDFSAEQFYYWHAHDCLIEDLCVLREYDSGRIIHNRSEC
jgi:hypothetical protein